MLMRKLKLGMMAGVFAVSSGIASTPITMPSSAQWDSAEAVDVAPRAFAYRMAGDFSQAGRPVDAPLVALARISVLHIMKQQVTAAEYDRCVAEAKCMPRPSFGSSDPNLPVVQLSWDDATAYASWLSAKTGETWRLPTDEEWVFAAGSRFHDDALSVAASRDPSVRWLARYEKESEQEALDQAGKLLHYDRAYYIGENDFMFRAATMANFRALPRQANTFPRRSNSCASLFPRMLYSRARLARSRARMLSRRRSVKPC
jgi:formylglycine-generating enzyme required for sulfatase activity